MTVPHTAMLFAAGLGTRMRPLTDRIPKPLIEVAGRSLIDRALDFLEASEIEKVVVNTAYKSEMIEAHLKQRSSPQVEISREPEPLETGGGIVHALPKLGEGFIAVMNSDVICIEGPQKKALQRLAALQKKTQADAVLLLHPVEKALGYEGLGDFFIQDRHGLVPRMGNTRAPYVFTGIQLLNQELFRHRSLTKFSLSQLFRELLTSEGKPRIAALVHEGEWLHVGDMAGLEAAEAFLCNQ